MTVFHIPRFGKKPRGPTRPTQREIKQQRAMNAPLELASDLEALNPKVRAKPRHLEESLQISIVRDLRQILQPSVILHHSPNGGKRDAITGARLKAMGTLAGFADLSFYWPTSRAVFIELKYGNAGLSDNQEDFATAMRAVGFPIGEANSLDAVLHLLRIWEVPTRIAV